MQEDNNIDLQQEAKDLVLNELEKNGVINYMRAKIKKSIIDIISHQKESIKQKLDFDFMTPLHRLNKPKEIVLVCQLIKEFLKFYELEYTLPIFENESNVREDIKRETLLKELKLEEKKDSSKPVLLLLLQDKLDNKDNTRNNQSHKTLDRYDFNTYNKSEVELSNEANKNKLNPSSFGSTNKSLDMTEPTNINKFNTFNMNEAFKNENKPIGDLINENVKNNKEEKKDNQKEIMTNNAFNKWNENNKINDIKENSNIDNENQKNDECQDGIKEEIYGKDLKEKDENKNEEMQSTQAYEGSESNK